MISFPCPKCGRTMRVKDYLAGTRVKCRQCGQSNYVPRGQAGPAGAAAASAADRGRPTPARQAAGAPERTLQPRPSARARGREDVTLPPVGPPPGSRPTPRPAPAEAATRAGTTRRGPASEDTVGPAGEAGSETYDFLAPPQAPDELGRLGPYRVLRELGAGGMGVVFLAEDPQLGRQVALKAMLPDLAAMPGARERFLREARAAAAVKHDHVVTLYQVGEDRGVPFLAMEFLQGESLEDRLERPPDLGLAEVVRIGREVAEGLAAAHARGLIHRDIKPANVWLEAPRCRVKVLDFGLARTAEDDNRLTQHGIVLGTPAYMAPEQANAESVDSRCDLFSLGCVLYRMATGTQPFQGADTIATMVAVTTAQPRAPHELNPALPPALSDLILHLLEKDPARRPQTAAEVAEALARLPVAGAAATRTGPPREVITVAGRRSRPDGAAAWADLTEGAGEAGPGPARPRRRRPPLVLIAAAVLGAALTVTGVLLYRVLTDRGELVLQSEDPQAEVLVTQDGKPVVVLDATARPRADLRSGQYDLVLTGNARDYRLSTNTLVLAKGEHQVISVRRVPAPAAEAPAPPAPAPVKPPQPEPLPDTRAAVSVPPPTRPEPAPAPPGPLPALPPVRFALAPGMSRTVEVYVDRREVGGPVEVRAEDLPPGIQVSPLTIPGDQDRGRLTLTAEAGAGEQGSRPGRLVIAADGKHRDQPLAVVLLPPLALTGHTVPVHTVAFSPDGRQLGSAGMEGSARGSARGEVRLWDPATGNLIASLDTRQERAVGNLTFSPDGVHFAAPTAGGAVGIWETATAKQVHALGRPFQGGVASLQYSPNGAYLAASGPGSQVVLWDPRTGKEVRRLTGTVPVPAGTGPALVRPGMRGVSAAPPRPVRAVVQLAFRPDSQYLAGACGDSGVALVWNVLTGQEGLPVTGHAGRVESLAFSPDGMRLATASGGSADRRRPALPEVKVWDAQNGAQLVSVVPRPLDEAAAGSPHVSFSPNNRYVANVMTGWRGRQGALDVWDAQTGRKVLAADGVRAIAFFPDGARLAGAGADGTVRVWALPGGEELLSLAGNGAVDSLAVSPDGVRLAAGGEDGGVRVWAVPPGPVVVTLAADARASWHGQPFAGR